MKTLTEQDWTSAELLALQNELLTKSKIMQIDFSSLEWVDLWPLSQLLKLIYIRLVDYQYPLRIILPAPENLVTSTLENTQEIFPLGLPKRGLRTSTERKHKPLCFLVDIGFVPLACSWKATFSIARRIIDLKLNHDDSLRLDYDSLRMLESYGYWNKEYSDKIILPFQVIKKHDDVEKLRNDLNQYIKNIFKYYENDIVDIGFVDIFFRELAENAVEHSGGEPAFVAARLIRSVWDISDEIKRRLVVKSRERGKLVPLKEFLKLHKNEGFIEMIVVDKGVGIVGTLSTIAPPESKTAPNIYQYAMKPEISRFTPAERHLRHKSPLTGLGACAHQLESAPAVLVFREAAGGCIVRKVNSPKQDALTNIEFLNIPNQANELLMGCNIQLAIAISAKTRLGTRISLPEPSGNKMQYVTLTDRFAPFAKAIKRKDELKGIKIDSDELPVCIVDITGMPEDKDSAFQLINRLHEEDLLTGTPKVLVGVTELLCNQLSSALVQYKNRKTAKVVNPCLGWLALSATLELFFIGTDAELKKYLIDCISNPKNARFDRYKRELFEKVNIELRLCSGDGSAVVNTADIIYNWIRGIGQWILMKVKEQHSEIFIDNQCILLPNKRCVSRYLDIYSLLRSQWSRAALMKATEISIAIVQPSIVVTYSSGLRQLCAHVIRNSFRDITLISLPDPYAPTAKASIYDHYKGAPTLIIGDAIFTGGHASRIVRGCKAIGLDVRRFLAILDSHPDDDKAPDIPVEYGSLIRFPFLISKGDDKPILKVDPYSLCLRRVLENDGAENAFRDENEGASFYHFVDRQKAILNSHCLNASGRHFVTAIDFKQIINASSLNYLIENLIKFSEHCKALIYPEESTIGMVAEEIARKIGIPHTHLIPAVMGRRINKEYTFTTDDEAKLFDIATNNGGVIFIDDAIHHGRVLTNIATAVERCGIKNLSAWFILNNTPPATSVIKSLSSSKGNEITISISWMFRSFIPVHNTGLSCPYCKISSILSQTKTNNTHSLISNYIEQRTYELRSIDPKTAILDPWRYVRSTEPLIIPLSGLITGIPKQVTSIEAFELALLELSQFEEGIIAMCNEFGAPHQKGSEALFARILGSNMSTLDKISLRRDFLSKFHNIIRNSSGDSAAYILETALLWPIEILCDEGLNVTILLKAAVANSDAGAATLYCIMKKILDNSSEDIKAIIYEQFEQIKRDIPDSSVQRGIVSTLIHALQYPAEDWDKIKRSLLLLIRRFLIHQREHHRILYSVSKLSSILLPSSINTILGVNNSSDSILYQALMMGLGDIEKAVTTLVHLKELPNYENIKQLRATIKDLFMARSELRDKYYKLYRDRDRDIETLCTKIRHYLEQISSLCLKTGDAEESIIPFLKNRLLKPNEELVEPLEKELKKNSQLQITRQAITFDNEKTFILADTYVVNSIISNVVSNISDHATGDLFKKVTLTCFLEKNNTRCVIKIQNGTNDINAGRKFQYGSTRRHITMELLKYGGTCEGYLYGNEFTTEINFMAL